MERMRFISGDSLALVKEGECKWWALGTPAKQIKDLG